MCLARRVMARWVFSWLLYDGRYTLGIDLFGARDRLVTEQFLHASHVCPIVQQAGGETVSQCVRADRRIKPGPREIFVELAPDTPGRKPLAVLIDEQCLLIEPWTARIATTMLEVFLNRADRGRTDRRRALLFTSAANVNDLRGEIHVAEIHVHQFADPDTGGEKHFEHGPIAGSEHGAVIRCAQECCDRPQF